MTTQDVSNPEGQEEGVPYLHNYADGVPGHYCIGIIKDNTSWFWNNGKWASAGQVFDLTAKVPRS